MKSSKPRTRILTTALISALALSVGVASAHGDREAKGSGHIFEKLDANKDGKITRAEAQTAADARFAQMDGNKDGAVTQEEAKAAWTKKRAEHQAKRAERADKSHAGHKGGHGPGGHGGGKFFAKLDSNQDGKISRAEADSFETTRFNAVDINKDGAITQTEAKAHREAMKKKWQEKKCEGREDGARPGKN